MSPLDPVADSGVFAALRRAWPRTSVGGLTLLAASLHVWLLAAVLVPLLVLAALELLLSPAHQQPRQVRGLLKAGFTHDEALRALRIEAQRRRRRGS